MLITDSYTLLTGWSHAEGMTGYLKTNEISLFDFAKEIPF